ncbi:MAG TPA: GAF domain-containing protein [Terriglobia bacterium]|nr:GAF domain-containing protein [Terriglobia bacterium]
MAQSSESVGKLKTALRLKSLEIEILHKISQAISSNLNLEEVLRHIIDLVNQVTRGDSCLLYLLDKANEELILRASKNPHPKIIGRIKVKVGEGITGWVARERQPVAIHKAAYNDPRFKLFHNLPEDRYQAFLSAPVITNNEVIGVINVQHRRLHRHTLGEIALLTTIASQVGGAIENARLYEETKRKAMQLETISNVSKTITSHHYLDDMLNLIVRMVAEAMTSPVCSIMLVDERTDELVIKASESRSEDYKTKPNIKVKKSLLGTVVLNRKPLIIRDVTQAEGYMHPELAKREGLCSLISLPMMIKDKVIGVFNLYTSKERVFSHEEVQLLSTVANQAAVAVENTKLMSVTMAMQEQLETRKLVERAKGILIRSEGIGEAEAYRRIQIKSMNLRKSMREISEAIILAAEMKEE